MITIGDSAFENAKSLINLKLNAVTNIGKNAFSYAEKLEYVDFGNQDVRTYLNDGTFDNCISLEIITGLNASYIGAKTFQNCKALIAIESRHDTITYIGDYAFSNCEKLLRFNSNNAGEAVVPYGVTYVGEYAFENCKKLTFVSVPDSAVRVEEGAFKGCESLEEMVLPFVGNAEGSSYEKSVFGYIFGYTNGWNVVQALTSQEIGYTYQFDTGGLNYSDDSKEGIYGYYIPKSIRKVTITKQSKIPNYAFKNCDLIEEINLHEGVTIIGDSSFENCRNLETIVGENATYIGNYAFRNMQKLKWFVFSENLTKIGSNVFENCLALTDVYYRGTDELWETIDKRNSWDEHTYFYFHSNVNRYGLYLGLSALHYETTDDYYALIPCNATNGIRLIDTENNQLVSSVKTQITFRTNSEKVSLGNLSLRGDEGGFTVLSFNGTVDGEFVLQENIYTLVIQRSTGNTSLRFDQSELDYLELSLDMTLALYNIANPKDIVKEDISPSAMENTLCAMANLSDVIGGLFRLDAPQTTHLKKVFGGFIQDYANSNYAHEQALDDAEIILEVTQAIEEGYKQYGPKKLKDYFNLPQKAIEAIENICGIAGKARDYGIDITEVRRLGNLLNTLTEYEGFEDWLRSSDRFLRFVKDTQRDYNYFLSSLKNFQLFSLQDNDALITLWDDNVIVFGEDTPDVMDIGWATLDMVLYIACDYTNNIQIIERMRSKMLESGYYTASSYEIHVLNEILASYKSKWLSGISRFATDLAGLTVSKLLEKNPVISVFTIASELAMIVTDIDTKAELAVLNVYRDALYHCMGSVNSLFKDGKITTDIDELYFFSSLYLKMMLKSNELAREIVHDLIDDLNQKNDKDENTDLTTYQLDIATLDDNINRINELLNKIQKLVVSA